MDMNTPPGTSPETKLRDYSLEKGPSTHHYEPPSLTLQPGSHQGDSNSPFPAPSTAQGARVPRARSTKGKRPLNVMVRAGVALLAQPPPFYTFPSGCGLTSISSAPPSFNGISRKLGQRPGSLIPERQWLLPVPSKTARPTE